MAQKCSNDVSTCELRVDKKKKKGSYQATKKKHKFQNICKTVWKDKKEDGTKMYQ